MSTRAKRIARVAASGLLATAIDVGALLLLVEGLHCPVAVAAFLAAMLGAVASFAVNKFWAFRDPSPVRLSQLSGFAMVAVGSALGVGLCVQLLAVGMGLPYLLAKGIAAVLVFATWSYPVQSRVVFRRAAAA
jgi:putative flippase GtrA